MKRRHSLWDLACGHVLMRRLRRVSRKMDRALLAEDYRSFDRAVARGHKLVGRLDKRLRQG